MSEIPPSIKQQSLTAFFSCPKVNNSKELGSNSEVSKTSKRPLKDLTKTDKLPDVAATPVEHDAPLKRSCVDDSIGQERAVLSVESNQTSINKQVAQLKCSLATRPAHSVLDLIQDLHHDWISILAPQIGSSKFQKLADFIAAERTRATIYPPPDKVFSWSQFCPPPNVQVVILGQDPYHGSKQAHGLAFSVQHPLRPPPSLVNMYKEIASDLREVVQQKPWPPTHGDLTGWARQGVLLLNAVLTVRASAANSHKDQGWELLTEAVIRYLNKEKLNLVFMLWGAPAQKRGSRIDRRRHLVLQSPHPSPLSAPRGFVGCKHFSKANDYLRQHNLPEINWTQLDN